MIVTEETASTSSNDLPLNRQSSGPCPWCTVTMGSWRGMLSTLQNCVHTPACQYFLGGPVEPTLQPPGTTPPWSLPLLEMPLLLPFSLPAWLPLSKLWCFRAVGQRPPCHHVMTYYLYHTSSTNWESPWRGGSMTPAAMMKSPQRA